MISPDEIVYFKEVSRVGNLRRAAERLGVTQPTLSHSIKRIESKLKCQLFIRSKSGVRLTKAGLRLSVLAGDLEENWRRVQFLISEEVNQVGGTYTLGCHSSVGLYTVPKFLIPLLQTYPTLNIRFQHGLSREIAEAVISNRIDFGIIVNPPNHPDLVVRKLCEDYVRVWRAEDLQIPDVLICNPDLQQVQKMIQALMKKKITFKREIHSSSLELIVKMTSSGMGAGILPERVLKELGATNCVDYASNAPEVKDQICLVYKKENQMTAASKIVLDAILSAKY
jgi:DNA-binding transcriptional LysR family regulator